MTNRLANETSPYLLQHQNNPVDWFPWSEEALTKSKDENKPIFLSIGYSSCHWCHVMEHESFENDKIAKFLNENFVSIKVDREERPDLDQIYMNAVMALRNGQGGWPLSAFLTPDCQVFFGGTYWPATASRGMPGFDQVLESVLDAFQNRREQVDEQASKITDFLNRNLQESTSGTDVELSEDLLVVAANSLSQAFDFRNGGFGSSPKFPHAMDLQLLMRLWYRWREDLPEHVDHKQLLKMVEINLDKMADGGIYDHLAGGFARYSVDEKWLVPHFEKMLYDNALLTEAYVDAFLITRNERYKNVASETLDYVCNYMTDAQGGFYSAEDADSEGVEGKFYVWSETEIKSILGDELGTKLCSAYDVSESGNFEDENILNRKRTFEQTARIHGWKEEELVEELKIARTKLLEVRDKRVRPGLDDKVLVSWNGMMINAMVRAGRSFDEPRFVEAAQKAAGFILENLVDDQGQLLHTWRKGQSKLQAYLDDYACFINSLISIYETDFDSKWIDAAVRLVEVVMNKFQDTHVGGFYFVADDHERLIARSKDANDSSVPSGNSMMATVLVRVGRLCGRNDFLLAAEKTIKSSYESMQRSPMAFGQMLIALESFLSESRELVLASNKSESIQFAIDELFRKFRPNLTIAAKLSDQDASKHLEPILQGKSTESEPLLYVCENFSCQKPISGSEEIFGAIEAMN